MAERSLSVNLRSRVSSLVQGLRTSSSEVTNLGRKMTETGASADRMRKRLEAATKALPKIEIDADSTAAEIKFAELRQKLESLSSKKIGVDVSAEDARLELAEIERELSLLHGSEADIHVRADIGEALTELRAIDREVSNLDGRKANVQVDANVGGALGQIAMVGAALAALPAVTTIGVGVAALGSAFAAAGAGAAGFGAVAIPALGRVNEALQESESAAGGAGGAMKSAAQAAAESAQRATSLEAAEKRVTDAKKAAKSAEQDLTQARIEARRAAEELTRSIRAQALSEEDASLSVEEARLRLAETMADPKATDLERRRADLSYRQAQARLEDEKRRTKELAQEKKTADAAGIEGSKQVVAAKEKLKQANEAVILSEKQLKLLMLQQKAAMQQAAGGAGGAASKLSELTKAEKALYEQMKGFKSEYLEWQKELQPDVLPVIGKGLDLVATTLPKISPLVRGTASAFTVLLDDMKEALNGPFWNEFIYNLGTYAPDAIIGLGRSFGNVTAGIAGVVNAFLPFTSTVVGGVEGATKAFSEWGQELKDNPAFIEFMVWVRENAPEVWAVIKDIALAIGHVAEAVAPLGIAAFGGIGLLAKLLAGMDPGHIQAIALAVAAFKLASLGFRVAGGLAALPGKFTEIGEAANKAKTKVGGLAGRMTDLAGAIGVGGLAAGAGLTAGLIFLEDQFAKAALASERFTDKVLAAAGGDLDSQIAALNKSIKEQRDLMGPNIAGWIYFTESGQAAGDAADAMEERLAALTHQKEIAAIQAAKTGKAIDGMGGQVDEATKRVSDLDKSFDTFAGKTDALQAVENIANAYADAEKAIADANGKLEINSRMTNQQRDAVIRAREKLGEYLSSVREGADAQKIMGKNVFDSTQQVLGQLPKMMDLAGKNQEAREQVLLLAQAYGISREDAIKAAKGGKDLRDVIAQLKSKTLHISADTSKADAAIGKIIRTLNKTYVIGVDVRSDRQEHGNRATSSANGNMFVGGKVMAFAGGSENHVAQIGRPGEIRIWNEPETAGESYIPHALSKRARSMDILRATAEKFGQQVVPLSSETLMSGASTTSFGASASSVLTVNLDNADAVVVSLDNTTRAMTSGLSQASSTLTSAMGSSGTLTTAVGELGSAASVLGDSLSDAVSDLAAEMRALTSAISSLRSAVSSAQSAAAPKTSSTSTSTSSKPSTSQAVAAASTIKKSAAALLNKSQAGYVGSTGGSSGPAQKSGASSLIKGSGPSSNAGVLVVPMANGGLVTSPTILAGEAGREMVVPLSPSKRARGVSTLSAAAGVMGLTVSPRFSSTPSAPRYMQGRMSSQQSTDARIVALLEQLVNQEREPAQIGPNYFPEGTDGNRLLEQAYFKARVRRNR